MPPFTRGHLVKLLNQQKGVDYARRFLREAITPHSAIRQIAEDGSGTAVVMNAAPENVSAFANGD